MGMIFKISGGIFLVVLGLSMMGVSFVPSLVLGIIGVIAGVALLAGQ